ncbi:hypothetical protein ASPZODRAFT_12077 [Penicilliopsis zonata CBS 506.65]|uniref:Uncharacterized protein n=1 Tax=Penicilliopsis zonata CBS 506.65 TaxID=1073090 RepID=A0A1L9SVM7_9EURO|nr:hypothetical protein ASPZODRAFT_12077 [Penicilliopsis zonata CBS 506.65]OJJ51238.1 hypothetical protein ASPZODRAFT_12077 [Penicilliopsis zonata CBS 506.65]
MPFFDIFKSSPKEQQHQTWVPETLTMQQPSSPGAPTTERVVTEQPASQESMNSTMRLRGGEAGDICCGM